MTGTSTRIRRSGEPHRRSESLHAGFLNIFRDRWQRVPAFGDAGR